jgi:hypothetical protein
MIMKLNQTLRSWIALTIGVAFFSVSGSADAAAPKHYAAKPAAKAVRGAPRKQKPAAAAPTPSAAPIIDDDEPAPPAKEATPVPAASAADAAETSAAPASAGAVINVDVSTPPVAPVKAVAATTSPEELRARYDELRDAVFRSRARRETVEKALFSTKVAFDLKWEANRHYRIEKAELRLDGTRLWDASERPITEEPITLAARSVSPGAHVLSVRVQVQSRDTTSAGYVSEQSFSVMLPEGKETQVHITVDEDGSLPSYNPEIEIEIGK